MNWASLSRIRRMEPPGRQRGRSDNKYQVPRKVQMSKLKVQIMGSSLMTRAPFNALVYPCIKVGDNEFEYALLKRSDLGFWQGVAGGGGGMRLLWKPPEERPTKRPGYRSIQRLLNWIPLRRFQLLSSTL